MKNCKLPTKSESICAKTYTTFVARFAAPSRSNTGFVWLHFLEPIRTEAMLHEHFHLFEHFLCTPYLSISNLLQQTGVCCSLGSCMQTEILNRQLGKGGDWFPMLAFLFPSLFIPDGGLSPSSTENRKLTELREGWLPHPRYLPYNLCPEACGSLRGTATEAWRSLLLLRQQVFFSLQLMSHK